MINLLEIVDPHLPFPYRFWGTFKGKLVVTELEIKKQEIIRQIKSIADSNGIPPGMETFSAITGIKKHEWLYKFWRSWSEALVDAGYTPNTLATKIPDEIVLSGVLNLARKLGVFPNTSDLSFETNKNKDFPNYKTFSRYWPIAKLATAVKELADKNGDADVSEMCARYISTLPPKREPAEEKVLAIGYVYLIRYGKHHKIGRTNDPNKRQRQIQTDLPDETVRIHAILTDDPVGVEAYWHNRFKEKRGSGEWFDLSKADISAFKKWKKIA